MQDSLRSLKLKNFTVLFGIGVRQKLLEDDIIKYAGQFDGTICGDDEYSARVIEACSPRLKVVSKWGTGIDAIDKEACKKFGVMIGNTLYLNSKQVIGDNLFPLLVSTRDPAELEKPTATDILNNDEDFLNYLRRKAPDMVNVGIVIGETAYNEIGFEEADAVAKLTALFKKLQGGSLILFHEKGGELTDMKKLY